MLPYPTWPQIAQMAQIRGKRLMEVSVYCFIRSYLRNLWLKNAVRRCPGLANIPNPTRNPAVHGVVKERLAKETSPPAGSGAWA